MISLSKNTLRRAQRPQHLNLQSCLSLGDPKRASPVELEAGYDVKSALR